MTGPRSRQTKRLAGIVALAALLAFAGCNGVLGGDQQNNSTTSNATVTPADVPTDQPTETPAQELAPGLTSAGVTSAEQLLEAQSRFLENHSTVTHTNTSVVAENGTVLFSMEQTIRRGQPDERVAYTANYTGPVAGSGNVTRIEGWRTDEWAYTRQTFENGSTNFSRSWSGTTSSDGALSATAISTYLADAEDGNVSVVTRQANGSPRYVVSGALSDANVSTNYRLTIDEQGVTRDLFAVRPNYGGPGEQTRGHVTMESTGNESLNAPEWLSEARQTTRTATASIPTARSTTTHLGTSESSTSAVTESGNTTIDGLVETTTA